MWSCVCIVPHDSHVIRIMTPHLTFVRTCTLSPCDVDYIGHYLLVSETDPLHLLYAHRVN